MPDAIGSLKVRRQLLLHQVKEATRHRDRYQETVNSYQATIDKSLAEIESIDLAIEVLDAAVEYSKATKEEGTNG